jgi:hypothetical protein
MEQISGSPAGCPTSRSPPAVALVSPAIRLAGVVAANERRLGVSYRWTAQSRAAAEQLDFVARAGELANRDAAVLLVVGALDDQAGIRARRLGCRA